MLAPLDATLHVHFARMADGTQHANADPTTIAKRLSSGSPFRAIVFHAPDRATADEVARASGLRALVGEEASAPTITCAALGPVALVVSALWGAVGSCRVYDAQTRYLIERGYFVVRLFVDHYPLPREAGVERRQRLLGETIASSRGHLHLLAARDVSEAAQQQLAADPAFRDGTPVGRLIAALGQSKCVEPLPAFWAGSLASVALVNHAMHVAFAERITRAPIVLETHDILAAMLDIHGIPKFARAEDDVAERRRAEEEAVWRRAAACVSLSPADHALVRGYARHAEFVRPASSSPKAPSRPWTDFAAANKFPPRIAAAGGFDVLLWGTLHGGNLAATMWFLDEVRAAHARLAGATIGIAGRMTGALPSKLAEDSNVFVLGHVDRIEDAFAHAAVLVIPDRAGSGISIKLMDALAAGRPFAATRVALRGIELAAGEYAGLDAAPALAEDIAMLLANADARRERAALAAALHARNFAATAYAAVWDRVLAKARGAAPAKAADDARAPVRNAPEISVVICTHERHELLDQAIASVLEQSLPAERYEIVVVDNSLDQAAAARHAERYRGARLRYMLEPKPGLSNARNVGTELARGDIIAFIDDDATASRTWLASLLDAYAAFPGAGAVGGRVVPLWGGARPPWLHDDLLTYFSAVDWGGRARVLRPGEWLAGTNVSFRRQDLVESGGFQLGLGRRGSDRVLLSNEEIEIMDRLTARGRSAVYAPEACVEHRIDPARLTPAWIRRRIAWQAVSDCIAGAPASTHPVSAFTERLSRFVDGHNGARPGFFAATDDPNRFREEAQIVYDLVMALLGGGVDVAAVPRNWRERLRARVARWFGGKS